MLKLTCGIGLGVDITDLLQLQGAFHSDRILITTSQKQGMMLFCEMLGEIFNSTIHADGFFNQGWQLQQGFGDTAFTFLAHAVCASETRCQQHQCGQLGGEGFGRGHTYFCACPGKQSEVYNAVVFGRSARGAVVASAADLIRGLDWLLGVRPDVINLSLSGPPNRMLSAAIEQMLLRGIRIVASVGNDGAAAFPRYPAAQPGVIAVTAVDTDMAVYTRAVRGQHVQFSALGVGLRLAAPDQRFAIKDGTSVASALASAVLAQGHSVQQYEDSAIDLGEPGFDDTFGFGLLNIDKIMTSSGE